MGTLYVAEYAISGPAQFSGSMPQAPHEPPLNEQTVSIGATSSQSNPFNSQTTVVRIHADSICSVLFGTNPSATTSNQRFIAGQTEYKSVPKGQGYIVAVIENS